MTAQIVGLYLLLGAVAAVLVFRAALNADEGDRAPVIAAVAWLLWPVFLGRFVVSFVQAFVATMKDPS